MLDQRRRYRIDVLKMLTAWEVRGLRWLTLPACHAGTRGVTPALVFRLRRNKRFRTLSSRQNRDCASIREQNAACSASDHQTRDLESCVWRVVPSDSSRHPQKVFLAPFSFYVRKDGIVNSILSFFYYTATWTPSEITSCVGIYHLIGLLTILLILIIIYIDLSFSKNESVIVKRWHSFVALVFRWLHYWLCILREEVC